MALQSSRIPRPTRLTIRPTELQHSGCYVGIDYDEIRYIVQNRFRMSAIPDDVWYLSCEIGAPMEGTPTPYVVNIYIYTDTDITPTRIQNPIQLIVNALQPYQAQP